MSRARSRALRFVAVGTAAAATVALSQATASGTFAGVTGNAGDSAASAATFCTAPATTLLSNGDSWTDESAAGTNHQSDLDLRVRSGSSTTPGLRRHIWTGFDLPAVPDPAHCQLVDARLSYYNKAPVSGRYIDVYRGNAAWTAATILWSNEPGYVGPAATTIPTTSVPGWQQWVVTAHVLAQYAGSNTGFVLRDRLENAAPTAFEQVYYDRQDATYRPTLVLTWG